ncbi:MAG: hypothetical protein CSA09_00785 [Candidatus Contendobacter odensis]|uniref:Uncharacterized protein n=1 Tax=Candidatus Contendibacter odensensis TaxID=1400860 RepID=A0A2G6PFU9_9GAMM|nr:MAG: hypothetical protein CSA09_00785 [Candidatus Contendobacter odensis]
MLANYRLRHNEEKRKTAIRLRKRDEQIKVIAETLDVSSRAVSGWLKRYNTEGPTSRRGPKEGTGNRLRPEQEKGTGNRLRPEQEKRIQHRIIDQTPDQLQLDYALWTRKAVKELIKQETGVGKERTKLPPG